MVNLFYLANTEGGGFGISSDILGSNLINLIIVIALLVVYGSKFIGNLLTERRNRIAEEIKEAEERATTSAKALAEAKDNLSKAQAKAVEIKKDAQTRAEKIRAEILEQGQQDIARMKATAGQELDSEKAKVVTDLKRLIAVKALAQAEEDLKNRLNDEVQGKLISKAVEQLGG